MSLYYSGTKMACCLHLATILASDINNMYTNRKAYNITSHTHKSYEVNLIVWNNLFFGSY